MPRAECGFDNETDVSGTDLLALHGPTILIDVGYDSGYGPNATDWKPTEREAGLLALIDTGASLSCIDDEVAKQLKLPIIDVKKFGTPNGGSMHNIYAAQIAIPTLRLVQFGQFAGVRMAEGGQPHRALLGRNLLSGLTMYYDGQTGTVTLYR
jgi:predicted aspartyl protease